MTNPINPEYSRKLQVAAEVADAAWISGGLDALQSELASWRRSDADPVIIAELERMYHKMVLA